MREITGGKVSQKAAAKKHKINSTKLLYKVRTSHENHPRQSSVFSKVIEELTAETLRTGSDWGFPMT